MPADRSAESGAALEAMASFRERARATNLARVDLIAEALDQLAGGVLADDARVSAQRAAHSVAGSAGTFGFTEASRLGRTLEALLGEAHGAEGSGVWAHRGLELVAGLRLALAGGPDPG
jgi:HPt (histidine-containing phosphotransfer) domain-containing protein